MLRLIYASRSLVLSESEMDKIVEKSELNNSRDEITGCLLFNDGVFLQYLEGPQENVRATFNRIKGDARHEQPQLMLCDEINERLFPMWAMAGFSLANFDEYEINRIQILFNSIQETKSQEAIRDFLLSVREKHFRFPEAS